VKKIMSNTDYIKISLTRWKGWKFDFIEWNLSIYWDSKKFVELKNQYPYSEIKVWVHKWKVNKYIIKEKIKLKKDENLLE
jgi:hypothetical protein